MNASGWVSLCACAGHLGLAILASLQRSRSALALPLALLCLDLFGWNFAALAYSVSGDHAWHVVDLTLSPLTPALALHVVAVFVGRARSLRGAIFATYAAAIALSMASALAFVARAGEAWIASRGWSIAFLALEIPSMALAVALLVSHVRTSVDATEQTRARAILAALAIAAVIGPSDFVHDFGIRAPALGDVATFASSAIVAGVALRLRLFGRALSATLAAYAFALAVLGVLGYFAVFRGLSAHASLLVLGTSTLTLALLAAAREVTGAVAIARARERQHATLGRMSRQLAHDLRNPIAALKGALQFLVEERRLGRSIDEQTEILGLLTSQVDRLANTVDAYERVGRVEPVRVPTQVNDVVREVLALQPFAASGTLNVTLHLDDALPAFALDRALFARALENVVRNACEAMPRGGALVVRTSRATDVDAAVVVAVEDTGEGMDARQAERAFDEFFTTKTAGSGLGLSFVKRVAEAHGGSASLRSVLGRGTVVEVRIGANGTPVERFAEENDV